MIWESLRVTGAIVETTNVGVEEIALGRGVTVSGLWEAKNKKRAYHPLTLALPLNRYHFWGHRR